MRVTGAVRPSYHHGNLPAAVLDEAIADLADADPVAINFHRIAKRLGVSHSALYRHYPTKQHLIDAVAERGFRTLAGYLESAVIGLEQASWMERMIALCIAYVRCAADNPTLMRVTFSPLLNRTRAAGLSEAADAALGHLRREITRAHDAGLLRSESVGEVTRYLWAGIHGEALLRIEPRSEAPVDQLADECSARSARWLVDSVLRPPRQPGETSLEPEQASAVPVCHQPRPAGK